MTGIVCGSVRKKVVSKSERDKERREYFKKAKQNRGNEISTQ